MSHNPNTVKSQDDLPTTNDGKRSSDVLLSTIEELERTKKQLDIAVKCLKEYANSSEWWTTENGDKCEYTTDGYEEAQEALRMIKELNK